MTRKDQLQPPQSPVVEHTPRQSDVSHVFVAEHLNPIEEGCLGSRGGYGFHRAVGAGEAGEGW